MAAAATIATVAGEASYGASLSTNGRVLVVPVDGDLQFRDAESGAVIAALADFSAESLLGR